MDSQLFETVLNKAQGFLKQHNINIVSEETLMKALPLVIECVETVKHKGASSNDKKKLALRVISFMVDKDKKVLLHNLIEGGTLDTVIDIIVDASKGKFDLNRKNKRRLIMGFINFLKQTCMSQTVAHEDDGITEEAAKTGSTSSPENEVVIEGRKHTVSQML